MNGLTLTGEFELLQFSPNLKLKLKFPFSSKIAFSCHTPPTLSKISDSSSGTVSNFNGLSSSLGFAV